MKRSILKQLVKYLTTSQLILPESERWKQSLHRFAMHRVEPLAKLLCSSIDDVQTAIKFSNQHDIDFVVKSGGINQACTSIRQQSLVLDLSMLKKIDYRKTSSGIYLDLQAGVNFVQIDHKLSQMNRVVKSGYTMPFAFYRNISCVGAYSIVGNGIAHRICGLGVDLVKSATVALGNGDIVTANEYENRDLLWGVKGCGGSFGAILSMGIELSESRCNVLDPSQGRQIRQYQYQFPLNEENITIGEPLKQLFQKVDDNIFPHLIFFHSPETSNLYLTLYHFLYNKSSYSLTTNTHSTQTIMAQLFSPYNQNIKNVTYIDKYNRQTGLVFKQHKRNYFHLFGGYTNIKHLPIIVSEINKYYREYPIKQISPSSVQFVIVINYMSSQAFLARDTSSTSWNSSKQENLFVYGNISFSDEKLDDRCYAYLRSLEMKLQGYLVRGSACDFNQRDWDYRNMGAWIYGDNSPKLKEIKQKYDPLNTFKTGLL